MGTLSGIIKVVGQLDGLSFYKLKDKIVVRKTGGFDGEKIKKEAQYVRVRENSSEFAESARAGKYFRNSIGVYLKSLQLSTVQSRVVSLFLTVARLDTESTRGARKVFKGLLQAEAAGIIQRFEFDEAQSFGRVFPFECTVAFDEGTLTVPHFQLKALKKPKGATRVAMRFIVCGLDFEQRDTSIVCESDIRTYDFGSETGNDPLVLTCEAPTAPTLFGLLFVQFYQQVNATEYVLQQSALKVVGIGQGQVS